MRPCTIEIGKGERLGWILPASQVSWRGGLDAEWKGWEELLVFVRPAGCERNNADSAGVHIHLLSRLLLDGREDVLSHLALQRDERGMVKIVPGEFQLCVTAPIAKQKAFGDDCQPDLLIAG